MSSWLTREERAETASTQFRERTFPPADARAMARADRVIPPLARPALTTLLDRRMVDLTGGHIGFRTDPAPFARLEAPDERHPGRTGGDEPDRVERLLHR